jgi:hypothetical protein
MHRLQIPGWIVEHLVLRAHLRCAADSERDVAHDIVHDFRNGPLNLRQRDIRSDREISAGNVEAHPAKRDFVFVSNDATDWLGITLVSVGAKHAALATGRDAPFNLPECRLVVLTENLRFGHDGVHHLKEIKWR